MNPPRCVLVVDDDAFQRAMLTDMLADLGVASVLVAADGRAATSVYESASPPPEVVIADLCMPGQDGFELLDALAARHFRGALVLMSGQEERILHSAQLMAQFHQLRVLAALAKPLRPATLGAALARLA